MPMNFIVLFFFGAIVFLLAVYGTQIKGFIGEKTTSSILYFLDKSKYQVVNNIVLNSGGKTSQIDHLVISDYGLFVIETKNYKGWILGGETSEYWTQVLFKRKEKFYNPIRQNYGHILALKNNLQEFPNIKYISIIVFSSKASMKVNTSTEVVYTYNLLATIKKYSILNLSETDKEKILYKINSTNSSKTYEKTEHIKAIKTRVRNREALIKANKCPNCGSELIFRRGKFGDFMGCSSFPYCKFTRNA